MKKCFVPEYANLKKRKAVIFFKRWNSWGHVLVGDWTSVFKIYKSNELLDMQMVIDSLCWQNCLVAGAHIEVGYLVILRLLWSNCFVWRIK
jgi:hypothetical protein